MSEASCGEVNAPRSGKQPEPPAMTVLLGPGGQLLLLGPDPNCTEAAIERISISLPLISDFLIYSSQHFHTKVQVQ